MKKFVHICLVWIASLPVIIFHSIDSSFNIDLFPIMFWLVGYFCLGCVGIALCALQENPKKKEEYKFPKAVARYHCPHWLIRRYVEWYME